MKKISSEITIDSPSLKIKWGTMDKKNPSSLYLEIGTYITPREENEDYTDNIKKIDKLSKQIIKNKINSEKDFNDNFIFVTDVADTRISFKKRSYILFQIHLLRNKKESLPFKNVVSGLNNDWTPIYKEIKTAIEDNGFECFKTKN